MSARLHPDRARPAGFRLSNVDILATLLCLCLVAVAWPTFGWTSLYMPFVLGHFFLFCNVFRIRRSFELAWAGVFLAQFAALATTTHDLLLPMLVQLPMTAAIIGLEMRSARYHGVWADRINDELDAYLESLDR